MMTSFFSRKMHFKQIIKNNNDIYTIIITTTTVL